MVPPLSKGPFPPSRAHRSLSSFASHVKLLPKPSTVVVEAYLVTSSTSRSVRIEQDYQQIQLHEIKRLAKTENTETAQVLARMSSQRYKGSMYVHATDVAR